MMKGKEGVWYIRRRYVRGDQMYEYYYKRELLTTDSYRNLDSVYWSADKPVSKRTWLKAQREGYKCDTYTVYLPPIELIQFPERRASDVREAGPDEHPKPRRGQVVRLLCRRLREPVGVRGLRRV